MRVMPNSRSPRASSSHSLRQRENLCCGENSRCISADALRDASGDSYVSLDISVNSMATGGRIKHKGSKDTKDTKSNSFDCAVRVCVASGIVFLKLNCRVAK